MSFSVFSYPSSNTLFYKNKIQGPTGPTGATGATGLNGLASLIIGPGESSNQIYTPVNYDPINGFNNSFSNFEGGSRVHAYAYLLPVCTITDILYSIRVGSTDGNTRCAIYRSDGDGNTPRTLIAETANTLLTGSGTKIIPFSVSITEPGLYYLALSGTSPDLSSVDFLQRQSDIIPQKDSLTGFQYNMNIDVLTSGYPSDISSSSSAVSSGPSWDFFPYVNRLRIA